MSWREYLSIAIENGTPCVSMEDIMYTFLSIVNLTEMSYIVTIGLVMLIDELLTTIIALLWPTNIKNHEYC